MSVSLLLLRCFSLAIVGAAVFCQLLFLEGDLSDLRVMSLLLLLVLLLLLLLLWLLLLLLLLLLSTAAITEMALTTTDAFADSFA